jgi:hypothetical protein
MMNSIIGSTEINKLDQFIRNTINEMIGGPALSKDLYYTATKKWRIKIKIINRTVPSLQI